MALPGASPVATAAASDSYAVPSAVVDSGGQHATSAHYGCDGSIGVLGSSSAAPAADHQVAGFPTSLFTPVALAISGPTAVDEGATFPLTAQATCDDATLLDAPPSEVLWSIASGPLSAIDTSGSATASPVWVDTPAFAAADFAGLNAQLGVLVRNRNNDNFGSYADDGLRDSWQVQWYGIDNPDAAPLAAPLGDGTPNLLKAAWNVPATDRTTHPVLTLTDDHLTLTFRRLRAGVTPRPTYVVQVSGDLETWQDDTQSGGPFTTEVSAIVLDADTELVTVRDEVAMSTAARRFMRLQVILP